MNWGQASLCNSAPTEVDPEGRRARGEHRDAGRRLACGNVMVMGRALEVGPNGQWAQGEHTDAGLGLTCGIVIVMGRALEA